MNVTELKDQVKSRIRILCQESETSPGNELIYAEGKNKEGFERLQVRLGKSEEEMHRIIAALYTSL